MHFCMYVYMCTVVSFCYGFKTTKPREQSLQEDWDNVYKG